MGDGNGTNCGVLILPQSLVARVRTVHSLRDAVHRLAKADLLAAVPTGDGFCRVLDPSGGVAGSSVNTRVRSADRCFVQ